MPFDRLPGANLNFSPLANIHPAITQGKPVFPTYEVVMKALNDILPKLDPIERQKRLIALQQLQDYPAQHALEVAKRGQVLQSLQDYPAEHAMKMKSEGLQIQTQEEALKTHQLQNKQKEQILQNTNMFQQKHDEWFGSDNTTDDPLTNGLEDSEIPDYPV